MVAKRVEEELAKHKDEIDTEVMRRVEEAKKVMEKQMLEEFERRKVEQMEALRKKEVKFDIQKLDHAGATMALAFLCFLKFLRNALK